MWKNKKSEDLCARKGTVRIAYFCVFSFIFFSELLHAVDTPDCVVARKFLRGSLYKFRVNGEMFHRIPDYGRPNRGRFQFSPQEFRLPDTLTKFLIDIDDGCSMAETYRCRGVRSDQVFDDNKERPIVVQTLEMLSVAYEQAMIKSVLSRETLARLMPEGGVRYCTSFKGARIVQPLAVEKGVDLCVGRSVGHPHYAGSALANDFTNCFSALRYQNSIKTLCFVGSFDENCSDAGEFFYAFICKVHKRFEQTLRIMFVFPFVPRDDSPTFRDLIIHECLRARCISAFKKFDDTYVQGMRDSVAYKDAVELYDRYVCDCRGGGLPLRDKVLPVFSDSDCNIFVQHAEEDRTLRETLAPYPRIDVLVGMQGLWDLAPYLSQAYNLFARLSSLFPGEHRVGYIDGQEHDIALPHNHWRGENALRALVYVAGEDREQAAVRCMAECYAGKFGYCEALPIGCKTKANGGPFFLMAEEPTAG